MVEEKKITGKKDFLVDVPVRINIWIRPKCQRLQFEVLKKARPSTIFLQSDGGRNDKEWEAIRQNRKIFEEEVDWNCTLYKIYEDHNNGLYSMGKKVSDFIWSKVDRCIFLEDDHIPAVCFFRYCAELLEKYKDDKRIQCVCGRNKLGVSENVTSDYFFSTDLGIWGIACWRDRNSENDPLHSYANDPYAMSVLHSLTANSKEGRALIDGYASDPMYGGHVAGSEFYHWFATISQHRLFIIPKYNLINNIGYGEGAAHAGKYMCKKARRRFDIKTYEYEFPLKHPKYVMPDNEYVKKVDEYLGIKHTFWGKLRNKIEYFSILVLHGEFAYIWRKTIEKAKGGKKIET